MAYEINGIGDNHRYATQVQGRYIFVALHNLTNARYRFLLPRQYLTTQCFKLRSYGVEKLHLFGTERRVVVLPSKLVARFSQLNVLLVLLEIHSKCRRPSIIANDQVTVQNAVDQFVAR